MRSQAEHMKKQKNKPRARKVLEKPPVLGWRSTDEDELNVRRWRGRTEIARIEALEPECGLFGTFRVRSTSGSAYEVEIRDLAARNNSCGCVDHRVNGLGRIRRRARRISPFTSARCLPTRWASARRIQSSIPSCICSPTSRRLPTACSTEREICRRSNCPPGEPP